MGGSRRLIKIMKLTHKHHIIPRHKGGTDDASNLLEVTPEEHAEIHRKLYEENGNEYDRIAWICLSGQIGKEEAMMLVQRSPERRRKIRESKMGSKNPQYGKPSWNAGLTKETDNRVAKNALRTTIGCKGRTPWNKGLTKDDLRVAKNSERCHIKRKQTIAVMSINERKEKFGYKNRRNRNA